MKLGSLFDGSGGFPLAGSINGIEPVWASEIEPFPVRVTKARFPQMRHLGDVTKIDGAEIDPVDIVTFGSPCQDLSVAGKQKGIHEGERSNLFFEAVRIIKEMRESDRAAGRAGKYIRPRWAVWENVPGAFSSNGGDDFRAVLQALAEVADPDVVVPRPEKWNRPGCIVGRGWSIAWRILDAQYWGVPQRRRRIYLVADFAGERAGEILFEREGVRGYFETGRTPWEGTAAGAEGSAGADDRERKCVVSTCQNTGIGWWNESPIGQTLRTPCGGDSTMANVVIEALPFDTTQVTSPQNGNNPKWGDPCHPLAAQGHPPTAICKVRHLFENHSQDTRYKGPLDVSPMLPAQLGTGGNNTPFVVEEYLPVYAETYQKVTGPLMANSHPGSYTGQDAYNDMLVVGKTAAHGVDCRNLTEHPELYPTLRAKPNGGQSLNYSGALRVQCIVRPLTPPECARLQGFPDWWDADVEGSDSARYKMWGNGIALPCAEFVLRRIAEFVRIERMGW